MIVGEMAPGLRQAADLLSAPGGEGGGGEAGTHGQLGDSGDLSGHWCPIVGRGVNDRVRWWLSPPPPSLELLFAAWEDARSGWFWQLGTDIRYAECYKTARCIFSWLSIH